MSEIDTNQSTLETLPSRPAGTSRCFAVPQATMPAVSRPLTTALATASCQVRVAMP